MMTHWMNHAIAMNRRWPPIKDRCSQHSKYPLKMHHHLQAKRQIHQRKNRQNVAHCSVRFAHAFICFVIFVIHFTVNWWCAFVWIFAFSVMPTAEGLPEELIKLFKPLCCDLCAAKLNSPSTARLHYESKNHEKKINNWLSTWAEQTGEPIPKRPSVCIFIHVHTERHLSTG